MAQDTSVAKKKELVEFHMEKQEIQEALVSAPHGDENDETLPPHTKEKDGSRVWVVGEKIPNTINIVKAE